MLVSCLTKRFERIFKGDSYGVAFFLLQEYRMNVSIHFEGVEFTASGEEAVDLSLAFQEAGGPSAWYVEPMRVEPVRANGFLGSVAEGGDVNFRDVTFNPHGNGTHTECVGHISEAAHSVNRLSIPPLMPCLVVSIRPEFKNEDHVITAKTLELASKRHWSGQTAPPSLVLRTLPNSAEKRSKNWSNTNAPYLEAAAAQWLVDRGVEHLLLDLPSVDREQDGGALAAHHIFWQWPADLREHATITEFIFVPDTLKDGLHLLNLQTAPFELDATPSRPVIIPCS